MAWYSERAASYTFCLPGGEMGGSLVQGSRWWLPGIMCPKCGPMGYGKQIAWIDGNDAIPLRESFTWLSPED